MSTLVSIKDLLIQSDIVGIGEKTNSSEDKKRRASHEFQAYAYRLAVDLNHLDRLPLYLRLAKTVPRNILEQTYTFVADANTQDKGPLFLWKLKQIRSELQGRIDATNFSSEFCLKNLKTSRSKISDVILKKNTDDSIVNIILSFLTKLNIDHYQKFACVYGAESINLLEFLSTIYKKIYTLEPSTVLSRKAKAMLSTQHKSRILVQAKSLYAKTKTDKRYSMFVVPKLFMSIPIEEHTKFFGEISAKMEKDGIFVFGTKISSKEKQSWGKIYSNSNELVVLQKFVEKEKIQQSLENVGFATLFEIQIDSYTYFLAQKI